MLKKSACRHKPFNRLIFYRERLAESLFGEASKPLHGKLLGCAEHIYGAEA
jgi:hypothetical protein